jgi:hypothetical protein
MPLSSAAAGERARFQAAEAPAATVAATTTSSNASTADSASIHTELSGTCSRPQKIASHSACPISSQALMMARRRLTGHLRRSLTRR